MSPQTQEPGTLRHLCFPPLKLGPAGPRPSPSNSLTAALGQKAAGTAAQGRTGLLSVPRELQTLRDLHTGPFQSIPHHSRTRASQPLFTTDSALPCWMLPAIPWRGQCPFLGDVPEGLSHCNAGTGHPVSLWAGGDICKAFLPTCLPGW